MNKRCRVIREPEGPRALFKGRAGQGPTIFAGTRMDHSRSCEPEFARLLKTLQERQDAESAIKAVKGGDHKAALRELEESNDRLLNEITSAIRAKIGR